MVIYDVVTCNSSTGGVELIFGVEGHVKGESEHLKVSERKCWRNIAGVC